MYWMYYSVTWSTEQNNMQNDNDITQISGREEDIKSMSISLDAILLEYLPLGGLVQNAFTIMSKTPED